jgi:hypothetical protein
MIWREVKQPELTACLALDPKSTGESIVGQETAFAIWKGLLGNPAFHCALIESATNSSQSAIVGFGASVFLDPNFAKRELHSPAPDLNSRIFAGIAAGEPVLRSESSLVGEAAQDGLDLVLLCNSFSIQSLPSEEQVEASILLPQALVHLHVGYRVRRILMETTNERMRLLAASSGVWRTVGNFPEQERALMIVTQDEAMEAAGFGILGPLFLYKEPILGLRDTEKQLLCQAIHGDTDAQLALSLHISVSSVKKRWTSLFSRIADLQPNLLPEEESASKEERRGSQKRHRILTYVRGHPEELRPFRWYPSQEANDSMKRSPTSLPGV